MPMRRSLNHRGLSRLIVRLGVTSARRQVKWGRHSLPLVRNMRSLWPRCSTRKLPATRSLPATRTLPC